MKTWQKATFIIVLVLFIATSVTISFLSMARAPFEYEYQTEIVDTPGNEGWVLFGFNGNTSTKEVFIDYVRDEDGNNPDESKPVSAVGAFTMNTDEKEIGDMAFFKCENITLVNLPDGLEKIGADAFSYCHGMKPAIFIPGSVKEIDSFAFYFCSNLKEFYMGKESKEGITFGDSWLPKNIKKAVLAGHLHFDFECRLPNGAMQFVTNRGDRGNAREMTIV